MLTIAVRAPDHGNLTPWRFLAIDDRVAFSWRAMDAFYEEDERIVGHAADPYHRNDIRAAMSSVRDPRSSRQERISLA